MQTIRLSDYGIYPDSDITLSLYELFQRYPNDTEFIYEEGDYYFSPKRKCSLTIDFQTWIKPMRIRN